MREQKTINHGHVWLDNGSYFAILSEVDGIEVQLSTSNGIYISKSITHDDFTRIVNKLNQAQASLDAARMIAEAEEMKDRKSNISPQLKDF